MENVDGVVEETGQVDGVAEGVQDGEQDGSAGQSEGQEVYRTQEEFDRAFQSRLARSERNNPQLQFVSKMAKQAGYDSVDEYMSAVEAYEQQQQEQMYKDQGIDPNLVNQLIDNNPTVQAAQGILAERQQEQALRSEIDELVKIVPDLKEDSVTDEVFKLRHESIQQGRPISLTDAFLRVNYQSLRTNAEQNVIKGLQANQQSTPGAVGSFAGSNMTDINKMSPEQFAAYKERLAGY